MVEILRTALAFEVDMVRFHVLSGYKLDATQSAPIFLSQSLGYWPSRETITAQAVLTAVYVLGAAYVFVLRPRLRRSTLPAVAASAVK